MPPTTTTDIREAIKQLMGEITLAEIFEYDSNGIIIRTDNGFVYTPFGKWLIKLEHLLDNWDLVREVQELYRNKV